MGNNQGEARVFKISKEEYMIKTDQSGVYLFPFQPLDFVPIGATDIEENNYWVIGLLLLKSYYTIYDLDS